MHGEKNPKGSIYFTLRAYLDNRIVMVWYGVVWYGVV